jgi:ribosomal protein L7Ae-like RNA K-turn-binding protein
VVEVDIVILMVRALEAIVAEHASLVFLAVSADPNDVVSVHEKM